MIAQSRVSVHQASLSEGILFLGSYGDNQTFSRTFGLVNVSCVCGPHMSSFRRKPNGLGEPVFRVTRLPVHMVAALLAEGSPPGRAHRRLSPSYGRDDPASADLRCRLPLGGRPRRQPWRDHEPVRRTRRRVQTIALS